MKTFSIHDALMFLGENGYDTNEIIVIWFANQKENKFEFKARTISGNELFINLDEGTVVVAEVAE